MAITLLRPLIVYVVQSIEYDNETEHFEERDCHGSGAMKNEPKSGDAGIMEIKIREQIPHEWFENFKVRTLSLFWSTVTLRPELTFGIQ